MKISFLINNIYGIRGTNRAVINLAEALAVRHDVEIVSVFRRATTTKFEIAPRITVRALVDLRPGSADRGATGSDEPSEVVPAAPTGACTSAASCHRPRAAPWAPGDDERAPD